MIIIIIFDMKYYSYNLIHIINILYALYSF